MTVRSLYGMNAYACMILAVKILSVHLSVCLKTERIYCKYSDTTWKGSPLVNSEESEVRILPLSHPMGAWDT